ncbi:MAG: hypothetical protein RR855_20225 [Comamonas sp.]
MWPFDLLRKLSRGPDVGETFRHFIGCYLFGFEAEGEKQPTYIALPSNLEWLEREVRQYLQEFVDNHPQASEVPAIQAALADLPQRLAAHVAGDMGQPFLALPGVNLFVRKGMRERRKENGKYAE